ncbi:hypothetical protein NPIL_227171 [Nephila pilipes]|uniref:Uncharacterized protein n=1 Tax=Nephila pilipes TaxID=299642 RepID=A0A8X6MTE3_NEPPI|nr:hypothetical protein NPIL_227171 [Nephila pilipes]
MSTSKHPARNVSFSHEKCMLTFPLGESHVPSVDSGVQLVGGPPLVSDPYLWHDSRPSSLKANRCSSCSSHHPSAEGRSVRSHGAMTTLHMFIFGTLSRALECSYCGGCSVQGRWYTWSTKKRRCQNVSVSNNYD